MSLPEYHFSKSLNSCLALVVEFVQHGIQNGVAQSTMKCHAPQWTFGFFREATPHHGSAKFVNAVISDLRRFVHLEFDRLPDAIRQFRPDSKHRQTDWP